MNGEQQKEKLVQVVIKFIFSNKLIVRMTNKKELGYIILLF